LASRHHSLDLSELKDVTDLLQGFQEQNSCIFKVRFGLSELKRFPAIAMVGEAWSVGEDKQELKLLASVSVICSDLNLRTWNGALTQLMYMLDFQLALNEFETKAPKRA